MKLKLEFITNPGKRFSRAEVSSPLDIVLGNLIFEKNLEFDINKKDRVMFIKSLLSYFNRVAEGNKNQVFSIKISKGEVSHVFKYRNKILPFTKKSLLSKLFLSKISFHDFINHKEVMVPEEPFYDCNYPEEKPGFKIVECSEDIYKYEKVFVPISLNDLKSKRTHYLKWHCSEDISIRLFLKFEDQPNKENCYFMKSHKFKEYIPLTEKQAEILINDFKCVDYEEIIGIMSKEKYIKTIIKNGEVNIIKE